jgi:hypothetical protein
VLHELAAQEQVKNVIASVLKVTFSSIFCRCLVARMQASPAVQLEARCSLQLDSIPKWKQQHEVREDLDNDSEEDVNASDARFPEQQSHRGFSSFGAKPISEPILLKKKTPATGAQGISCAAIRPTAPVTPDPDDDGIDIFVDDDICDEGRGDSDWPERPGIFSFCDCCHSCALCASYFGLLATLTPHLASNPKSYRPQTYSIYGKNRSEK